MGSTECKVASAPPGRDSGYSRRQEHSNFEISATDDLSLEQRRLTQTMTHLAISALGPGKTGTLRADGTTALATTSDAQGVSPAPVLRRGQRVSSALGGWVVAPSAWHAYRTPRSVRGGRARGPTRLRSRRRHGPTGSSTTPKDRRAYAASRGRPTTTRSSARTRSPGTCATESTPSRTTAGSTSTRASRTRPSTPSLRVSAATRGSERGESGTRPFDIRLSSRRPDFGALPASHTGPSATGPGPGQPSPSPGDPAPQQRSPRTG